MVKQENIKMAIIPVVVEQHAEEAAFLWLLRDSAVIEPHYSLPDLAHLDDRVEAHIDGLRIAGEEGWGVCKDAIAWEEPGEIYAAAVLAFESRDSGRIKEVIKLGISEAELSKGLISALGWIPFDKVAGYIQKFLDSGIVDLRRISIAAMAVHRQQVGRYLDTAINDEDPALRARALKAVGELGRKDLLHDITSNLSDEDDKCRFYAGWSAAILGDTSFIPVLQKAAQNGSPYSEKACTVALRRMSIPEGHAWIKELAINPEHQRMAVAGSGALGDPAAIPRLIDAMTNPELARVAGEAFSMITGVDIVYEDLEGEWPEGFEAGPTENPEDEDIDMDPDEDLPWPAPELIADWWQKNKGNFQNGTRYLCGKPISEEQCQHILRHGFQRQRAAAALELAVMKPGQPLFEVRAPGFRQQQLLGLN
jgi:uncharacterized protein (TIGR02270 family)